MRTLMLGACVVTGLAINAVAAVPGLPFTEDFADTNLYDSAGTTANWSVEEQKLIQSFHAERARLGNLPWTASFIMDDQVGHASLALGDVTGNGLLDLVVGRHGQPSRLYANNGTPDPLAGVAGVDISADAHDTYSIALGDMTGNGLLDLVVGNDGQSNRLYTNNGTANPFAGVVGVDIGIETDATRSIALGDLTGNGLLDLVVGNHNGRNRLYTNNGTATPFADVTGIGISGDANLTMSVALGDVTGNGLLDLVTGNWDQVNRLYTNNGTATPFADVDGMNITGDDLYSRTVALGDMNGNGRLDVVVGNAFFNTLYLNNGTSDPFAGVVGVAIISADTYNTTSIMVGDINGNGMLDVVAGNMINNRLYINNGTSDPFNGGNKIDIAPGDMHDTSSVAFGDVTGNGLLDLVVGNNGLNRLYTNNGTADPFAGVVGVNIAGDTQNSRAIALGDVTGNGFLDLVVGNYNQYNRLYTNNGTATPFAGITGVDITTESHLTMSVALGDVTGNGWLDLVVGNWDQVNRLYTNNGTATPFAGVVGVDVGAEMDFTTSIALGDMTGNGLLDLVVGNSDDTIPNRLYTNNATSDPFAGVAGLDITADTHWTRGIALGDVNGNGFLDFVAGNVAGPNRLYTNNGTADPFAGVTGLDISEDTHNTYSVALADVTGNGWLDFVAGNDNNVNRLYINNGPADPFAGVAGLNISADTDRTRGIALGDVTGNGSLDLVAGNDFSQVNRLYLNTGRERRVDYGFVASDITDFPHLAYSIALGDVNKNGFLDFVIGDWAFASRLYLNDGNGGFMTGQEIAPPGADPCATLAVALGDINGNGLLDLVVGNMEEPSLLYTNNGTASPFDSVAGMNISADTNAVTAIALGDMTGNGLLDLVTVSADQRNRLYTNNGTADPFNGVVGLDISTDEHYSFTVALGDVTGNGWLDVVVGNDEINRLYTNNGTGTPFDGVAGIDITGDNDVTTSVALGDMNGNGLLDLVVGNDWERNRLYTNNGTGNPFAGVVAIDITDDDYNTTSVALGDMNGNGRLDVVTMNWGLPGKVYLNKGDGIFAEGFWLSRKAGDFYMNYAVVLGDIDRDGNLDVIATDGFFPCRLYLFGRPFDFNRNIAGSLKVNDSDAPVFGIDVALTEVTPPNTSLDFYLSNNGGTNWVQAYDGKKTVFKTIGNDVRWKAVLKSLSSLHSAQLDELTLTAVSPEMLVLGTNGAVIASGSAASGSTGADFGAVLPAGALTNTFAITNSGDWPLAIYGWTTNGSGASAFEVYSMPVSVDPGGISNFNIRFAPAGEGTRAAALHVVNNSGTSPYIINLAGNGTKRDQTIDFASIGEQSVTGIVALAAPASSGLTVSFTNTPGSPVLWSDSTTISFSSTGTVGIIASQAGNSEWNPAPAVTNVFAVKSQELEKHDQIIEFALIGEQSVTGIVALAATASSGLTVSFTNTPGSPVLWSDSTTISFSSTGTVGIIASQPGNSEWNPAPAVTNVFNVLPGDPVGLPPPGDYTGNGKADLVVYEMLIGNWFIRSADKPHFRSEISQPKADQPLAENLKSKIEPAAQWGGPGFLPVPGDYNGNGVNDFAVYGVENGLWYIKALDGSIIVNGEQWGGPGFIPVAGDYDSSGVYDLAVYDLFTGNWFIRKADEPSLRSQTSPPKADQPSAENLKSITPTAQWGGPTMLPVSGDYDGDGTYDLAVYEQASGNWFIRSAKEPNFRYQLLNLKSEVAPTAQWGGPGFAQVSGDYDGSGKHDLAVYHQGLGLWYVMSVDGRIIVWGEQWGGPGFVPLSGDYTGDGKSDLAVYEIATGQWYVRTLAGDVVVWGEQWGGPGFLPVMAADAAVKPVGLVPVWRLYSHGHEEATFEHIVTADPVETAYLVSHQYWIDQGIAWYALVSRSGDAFPLYRAYNQAAKTHYWTIDVSIYSTLVSQGWIGEGVSMFVWATASANRIPVYQFYNGTTDKHLFTADENEKNTLLSNPSYGYVYQSIAFYVYLSE